jgi:hypothetical protein
MDFVAFSRSYTLGVGPGGREYQAAAQINLEINFARSVEW